MMMMMLVFVVVMMMMMMMLIGIDNKAEHDFRGTFTINSNVLKSLMQLCNVYKILPLLLPSEVL